MILKLVYGVMSTDSTTGPIFFEDTVYTERQIEQINHPFSEWLTGHEGQYAFFQQLDNAIAHTLMTRFERRI
jgi:hypothetical protein